MSDFIFLARHGTILATSGWQKRSNTGTCVMFWCSGDWVYYSHTFRFFWLISSSVLLWIFQSAYQNNQADTDRKNSQQRTLPRSKVC